MKYAIIDVGSNSLHLTVYEISGVHFKTLFRTKVMAGLAGYVEDGMMTANGIQAAESALLGFKKTLESLSIENVSVFATASLRNIDNSQETVELLNQKTGFNIEVIDGNEEALMSYRGAMMDLHIESGAFIDIGGASTEIISFENGNILETHSRRIGALSLYKKCVTKILPNQKAIESMAKLVDSELLSLHDCTFDSRTPLVCVGGTARTVLKLAIKEFDLPDECRQVTAKQVDVLLQRFLSGDKKIIKTLLRTVPDRIHTLVPGLFILDRIMHLYQSKEIVVSKYGVREGFLCSRIIQS